MKLYEVQIGVLGMATAALHAESEDEAQELALQALYEYGPDGEDIDVFDDSDNERTVHIELDCPLELCTSSDAVTSMELQNETMEDSLC